MAQLAFYYFAWHYSTGLRDYMRNWTNFIWFFWHFFSITILAKTFFAPLNRIHEKSERPGIHVELFFQNALVNIVMRLVGMLLRLILMVIGFLAIGATLILGTFIFITWIFMPLVLVGLIGTGIIFFIA